MNLLSPDLFLCLASLQVLGAPYSDGVVDSCARVKPGDIEVTRFTNAKSQFESFFTSCAAVKCKDKVERVMSFLVRPNSSKKQTYPLDLCLFSGEGALRYPLKEVAIRKDGSPFDLSGIWELKTLPLEICAQEKTTMRFARETDPRGIVKVEFGLSTNPDEDWKTRDFSKTKAPSALARASFVSGAKDSKCEDALELRLRKLVKGNGSLNAKVYSKEMAKTVFSGLSDAENWVNRAQVHCGKLKERIPELKSILVAIQKHYPWDVVPGKEPQSNSEKGGAVD